MKTEIGPCAFPDFSTENRSLGFLRLLYSMPPHLVAACDCYHLLSDVFEKVKSALTTLGIWVIWFVANFGFTESGFLEKVLPKGMKTVIRKITAIISLLSILCSMGCCYGED